MYPYNDEIINAIQDVFAKHNIQSSIVLIYPDELVKDDKNIEDILVMALIKFSLKDNP